MGILASFGIEPALFLFQLGNFIVVAVILWFLILKPLTAKLAERQKVIDGSLENAAKLAERLERSEGEYRARVAAAEREAGAILERAGADAATLSDEVKAKAKSEIAALLAAAKRAMRQEKEDMATALKRETADLVILALEKILKEKVTKEKDREYVRNAVAKLR